MCGGTCVLVHVCWCMCRPTCVLPLPLTSFSLLTDRHFHTSLHTYIMYSAYLLYCIYLSMAYVHAWKRAVAVNFVTTLLHGRAFITMSRLGWDFIPLSLCSLCSYCKLSTTLQPIRFKETPQNCLSSSQSFYPFPSSVDHYRHRILIGMKLGVILQIRTVHT